MKRILTIFLGTALVAAAGCEKHRVDTTPVVSPLNKSYVQVYNATVGAARNFVYVNGAQATGVTFATGTTFPANAYGFTVPSGAVSFLIRDTLSTTTQAQLSWIETMMPEQNYTIFMYDTITTAKRLTVANNLEIPSDNSARIRVANMFHSTAAMPNLDVFSFRQNANIFTNVRPATVTNYIPYTTGIAADTLYFREAGTMNQVFKYTVPTLAVKRSYTIITRGSWRITPASRLISLFANN